MVQVLHRLPRSQHPDLLVGTEHFDDAGVFRIDSHTALVQTVDFFPPLVEDPFTFGQIAAANALSDIYAMGGTPITALNIVGFPDKDLPEDILVEILRGGAERVTAAGAVIVGGHSVRDSEIKYGLAVTGRIDPARIITNSAARPGDVLVLSKPLGSGVLTTAAKKGAIAEADLDEAVRVMVHLNRDAAEAMVEAGVHAATDITGFGLVGHAYEVADGSGVTLEIEAARVPLMQRTLELARLGCVTRAHKSTINHLGSKLFAEGLEPALVNALCDAQTSGGLLMCVGGQNVDRLLQGLHRRGALCAAIIGRVLAQSHYAICLT